MDNINGSFVIGYDFTNGEDVGVLVVGVQKQGKVDIINAFNGKEAEELYLKLKGDKK